MHIAEVAEDVADAAISAVDWWTLGVAAFAAFTSLGSIGFSIWALRRTHAHEDRTWLREQTYRIILDFYDAVTAFQSYHNNEVIVATVAGSFTEDIRDEARRRQVVVQTEMQRLMLVAEPDLLTAAAVFQKWMDEEILGFPRLGDPPVLLDGESPLIVSLHRGDRLLLEMTNPVREAIGRKPANFVANPSGNTYGR